MEAITRLRLDPEDTMLDTLIAKLKDGPEEDARALLIEHLQTAHAYLHGAMRAEYVANLELAAQAARSLSDPAMKTELKESVAELVERQRRSPQVEGTHPQTADHLNLHTDRSVTASQLANYFQGRSVQLGRFYPRKQVIAVFPTFEFASRARQILYYAGFPGNAILAVSGNEFYNYLEDLRRHQGPSAILLTAVSRFLDTGAPLVDRYGEWASQECGFLVVSSPTEASAVRVSRLLQNLGPVAMHWFTAGYIWRLDSAK